MQGKYDSENAVHLDDLLTVVLISHNRPAFLRRAVQYYGVLSCKILVLDSSSLPTEGVAGLFENVEYQHLPQFGYWGMQAKLDYGVQQITTPYMVFAADDDFIVHQALEQSVSFLEGNADYGMCHGYCLMYLARPSGVTYFRRDKKVCEDYGSDLAQDRILDFLSQYLPPFYAVHRTALIRDWYDAMPEQTSIQWNEIGHAWYMLARAKARILPIPYVVREINYGKSEHSTEIYHTLSFTDPKSVADRVRFAGVLAALPTQIDGLDAQQGVEFVLQSFEALADCLRNRRSLTAEIIIESGWASQTMEPERRFAARQYVEMPFYNQPFFDLLSTYEFMLHAMPAGRVQMEGLEGVWARQQDLMRPRNNDTPESIIDRLWMAQDCNIFNREVVSRLARQLERMGDVDEARKVRAFEDRLNAFPDPDNRKVFNATRSGRLLMWLGARNPDGNEARMISENLLAINGGPQFGLLVLNLDGDVAALQITLDSLLEGHCKAFKIVVFTTAEPPAATQPSNTLHFVKVTQGNCIDKLNLIVNQSSSDWMLLLEAGDEFTASGLLRASLELQAAPECRAVAVDEIQRQADGALVDVFRPGFNLDLLQSVPRLMARHWLIRRDVLQAAGGYSADCGKALEFDLLLRIIEEGGMAWLAHLDEPVLICPAVAFDENPHERQALIRHLARRGFKAQVRSEKPGLYQIDYRHSERPLVSIIVRSQDNLEALQRCLASIGQRTRYTRYEILIADNQSQSAEMNGWLDERQSAGSAIRILRNAEGLSRSALINAAAREAKGSYMVLLDAEAEVVNPNWIESLLNQAQRLEVGVVGVKLIDEQGSVTQAGLILGMNGGVGSAFIGEQRDAEGYMFRLAVEQNYSAVSDACLMVRKEIFDAVGGLDEGDFAESLSDVDLCLSIAAAGFLIVWTPQVEVIHPGLQPHAPQALDALRAKWPEAFEQDLAYNKNLTLAGKGFEFGRPTSINWSQLLA
ncbi:glycosyl transferase family 2 [Pseudomonas syringae]|uniref:Glycosyl transferase family 2 n=1 Tax=Pseudomonas syringae TaxID=317 RepID=A0A1C7Z3T9_PSESX|nr:TIGR00180 family glycosyltransferase [Pseudomonas syringae]OCR24702.1 glycosyl transferase family 2 [Pseudomonas syringae]